MKHNVVLLYYYYYIFKKIWDFSHKDERVAPILSLLSESGARRTLDMPIDRFDTNFESAYKVPLKLLSIRLPRISMLELSQDSKPFVSSMSLQPLPLPLPSPMDL